MTMTAESTEVYNAPKSSTDRYLFNEYPLVIRPELARVVGLNGAIVTQQIHYWCELNEKAGRNKRDGHTWTYGSYEFWQEQFPWWSASTVRRIFDDLGSLGLIVTGQFNYLPQDRTKWYRVAYDALLRAVASAEIDRPSAEIDRPSVQNEQAT